LINIIAFRAYIYYGSFGYSYLGEGFNYSDHFVDLPLNSSISLLMFFCYALIYGHLRRTRAVVVASLSEKTKRKNREGKIALQFFLIASILACK
jgi:hypothetical protein